MLLREDPVEKQKLDVSRRLEASNKILCLRELERQGVARPKVEASFYRNGIKLGQRWGEGDWNSFLDRLEATIHPEAFEAYLVDDLGHEIEHEYEGVEQVLLRHLVRHEKSQIEFLERERQGICESTCPMEAVLNSELCAGLVGPEAPVGW